MHAACKGKGGHGKGYRQFLRLQEEGDPSNGTKWAGEDAGARRLGTYFKLLL